MSENYYVDSEDGQLVALICGNCVKIHGLQDTRPLDPVSFAKAPLACAVHAYGADPAEYKSAQDPIPLRHDSGSVWANQRQDEGMGELEGARVGAGEMCERALAAEAKVAAAIAFHSSEILGACQEGCPGTFPCRTLLALTDVDDVLSRAIRTLLPGLRGANYVERWSPNSPAVRALGILCRFVGEDVPTAGDLIDPDVPTHHQRRPEGEPDA